MHKRKTLPPKQKAAPTETKTSTLEAFPSPPTVLSLIQHDICKYADAISGIIGADVEIVDNTLLRVAGTGEYRCRLNENISGQGYIYKYIFKHNKTILVENPRSDPICNICQDKAFCKEMLDLSTPIISRGKTIGAIGIICSNKSQRAAIISQKEKYIYFIEQIASLIAAKAHDYLENRAEKEVIQALEKIIETMDRGVIIIDDKGTIYRCNASAMRILCINRIESDYTVEIDLTGDILYGCEEAYFTVKGNQCHVLCNRIEFTTLDNNKLTVIVFQDAHDFFPKDTVSASESYTPEKFLGRSPAIKEIKKRIEKIAASNASVLILGETGSGKEITALTIHSNSPRRNAPYVAINCAAIPEQLLESELFGYVRGAFSGADPKGRIGKFEQANGGTLFLDEIGDMPIQLQAKLLRVLQDKIVTRVGSNHDIPVDVRLITATNKSLRDLIEEKRFREELFYRINVVSLSLPPLRERREDIMDLAKYFLDTFCSEADKSVPRLSEHIANALYAYPWPGNIRELRNAMEYMLVMQGEHPQLHTDHLPQAIQDYMRNISSSSTPLGKAEYEQKRSLEQLLKEYGQDVEGKKKVARHLGIGIATLYRKLKHYNLTGRHKAIR